MKNNIFCDNLVYLKSKQNIKEEDLEFVFLFFETAKYSNGGDIIKSKYDSSANIIEILYRSNAIKQEILKRKYFQYEGYEFEAFEKEIEDPNLKFTKIKDTLIFENIDKNEDKNKIELYINYLVQENDIEMLEMSEVFNNVYCVKFQKLIDFENVCINLERKPELRKRKIKVYEVFESFSCVLKINNEGTINKNDTHLYFQKIFNSSNVINWQYLKNSGKKSFIIVNFVDLGSKKQFLTDYIPLMDQKFVRNIENVLNFHLLNDYYMLNYNDIEEGDLYEVDNETAGQLITKHVSKSNKSKRRRKIYLCHQCPFRTFYFTSHVNHSKIHEPSRNTSNSLKCKYCVYYTTRKGSLIRHENKHEKSQFKIEKN
jgi:hypothetical protein